MRKRRWSLLWFCVSLGFYVLLAALVGCSGDANGAGEASPPKDGPVTAYPRDEAHKVTILLYHHLVEREEDVQGNAMIVTAQRFAEDLQWLEDNGYTTVLPRDLTAGEPLPEKAVMITLDDGYVSNYLLAYPLLREHGMKAVIALICSLTDSGNSFYLSWDMCREMDRSGLIEFGSHTYDLHNLDDRNGNYIRFGVNGIQRERGESREDFEARVLPDLALSAQRIEEELGTEVLYFAYPFGVTEPWADDFIQDRFAVTVLTKKGAADLSKGFYDLPRKAVTMKRPASRCF